jgi:hypothetical protein
LDSRGVAPRTTRRRAAGGGGRRKGFTEDEWADGAEFEDGSASGAIDGAGSDASEVEAELAAAGWNNKAERALMMSELKDKRLIGEAIDGADEDDPIVVFVIVAAAAAAQTPAPAPAPL